MSGGARCSVAAARAASGPRGAGVAGLQHEVSARAGALGAGCDGAPRGEAFEAWPQDDEGEEDGQHEDISHGAASMLMAGGTRTVPLPTSIARGTDSRHGPAGCGGYRHHAPRPPAPPRERGPARASSRRPRATSRSSWRCPPAVKGDTRNGRACATPDPLTVPFETPGGLARLRPGTVSASPSPTRSGRRVRCRRRLRTGRHRPDAAASLTSRARTRGATREGRVARSLAVRPWQGGPVRAALESSRFSCYVDGAWPRATGLRGILLPLPPRSAGCSSSTRSRPLPRTCA